MIRALILLLFLGTALPGLTQGLMERKRPEIIPLNGQARRIGFYFAPGITYTLSRFRSEEEEVFRGGDTSFTATYDPKGRIGPYFEVGLSWYTRDPVIVDYLDLGIAYKGLRGAESFSGTYTLSDTVLPMFGDGSFTDNRLTLHFNANKFIPTWQYQFVQFTLGVNADLLQSASEDYTADGQSYNGSQLPYTPGYRVLNGSESASTTDLWGQVHFKLGYGFKVTGKLLIIPAVETPVFSFVPEDDGRFGALQWFSSDYRPLIFSVRFLFLRPRKGFDCPPPIKHKGQMKTYRQDGYEPQK
ncbi:MAG TPA: hypothetical protein PLB89_09890 [Flavobacteriales bacterium]|nr:hypothetical protein [Flavobacteriales bacterium]